LKINDLAYPPGREFVTVGKRGGTGLEKMSSIGRGRSQKKTGVCRTCEKKKSVSHFSSKGKRKALLKKGRRELIFGTKRKRRRGRDESRSREEKKRLWKRKHYHGKKKGRASDLFRRENGPGGKKKKNWRVHLRGGSFTEEDRGQRRGGDFRFVRISKKGVSPFLRDRGKLNFKTKGGGGKKGKGQVSVLQKEEGEGGSLRVDN